MSDWRIAKVFKERVGYGSLSNSANVAHYKRGDYRPNENTLRIVERVYPGTRMVVDDGPQFSYLWEALTGDPQHALVQIEAVWRNGVPVEHEVHVGGKRVIQDLVVPETLAARWNLARGERLNLAGKYQPWDLNDVCALPLPPGAFETYAAGAVLTLAPSATFTKEERLKTSPKVRLPFFASLSYRIAQARIKGENSLVLSFAAEPHITSFAGWLLERLLAELPKAAGFNILLERHALFGR